MLVIDVDGLDSSHLITPALEYALRSRVVETALEEPLLLEGSGDRPEGLRRLERLELIDALDQISAALERANAGAEELDFLEMRIVAVDATLEAILGVASFFRNHSNSQSLEGPCGGIGFHRLDLLCQKSFLEAFLSELLQRLLLLTFEFALVDR